MSDDADLSELPPPTRKERWNAWLEAHQVGKRWEAWHPLAIGVVVTVGVWALNVGQTEYDALLKDGVPQAVSVAAILAGFQGTIQAILLSMLQSRVVRGLKQRDAYEPLVHFVSRGTFSLVFFVAVSLVAIGITAAKVSLVGLLPIWVCRAAVWPVSVVHLPTSKSAFMAALLVGLFTYAMLASVRIMRLVIRMLRVPEKNELATGVQSAQTAEQESVNRRA